MGSHGKKLVRQMGLFVQPLSGLALPERGQREG